MHGVGNTVLPHPARSSCYERDCTMHLRMALWFWDVQAGKTNQHGAVVFSCPATIPKSRCFDLRSLTLICDRYQNTYRSDGCRADQRIRSKSDQNRCVMQRNLLRIRLDLWLAEVKNEAQMAE